jgi:ribose transport system permease protein
VTPRDEDRTGAASGGGGAFEEADAASTTGPLGDRRRAFDVEQLRGLGILLPFVALFVALSLASSAFLTKVNLLEILDQQSATLVVAAAGTLVLVAGGIDLSVGATYFLAGVVAAHFALTMPAGFAIVLGILAGTAVGLVNGLVVTVLRVNALITTLATTFVVSGVGSLVTSGNLIVLFNKAAFGSFAQSEFLGVRTSIWIMVIPVLGLGLLLARTKVGRYVYAVGGNASAARLAGVRVDTIRVTTFVLSGTMAGLAGVIDTSRVLSAGGASYNTVQLAFTVIAGVVVGGTSILGGDGAVWRTVVGILFIALIGNGYILLGLNPLYEQITLGVLLIAAVTLDVWSRRRRE